MSRFPLSDEARDQLEKWSVKARHLLDELLEDAPSDLQRELIARAIAAGHTPAEVHAFGDEIRALSDDAAFAACTLDEATPHDFTVAQLLRAEADPLFAFELKGGQLSPAEQDDEAFAPQPPDVVPLESPKPAAKAGAGAFDTHAHLSPVGSAPSLFSAPPPSRPLGAAGPPPTTGTAAALKPLTTRFLEDLVNEATRTLGVAWREFELDVPGGLKLEDAVPQAFTAVSRGVPVPAVIGPRPQDHRRLILLLQVSTTGKTRAWQLYDPLSSELLWANEGDLLARTELPFVNKANRRLTRIVLPSTRGGAFVP